MGNRVAPEVVPGLAVSGDNAALFSDLLGKVSLALETAPNIGAVREALIHALPLFNAEYYLLVLRVNEHATESVPTILTNYPKSLQVHYNAIGAWLFDPILERASQADDPFTWETLFFTPEQRELETKLKQYRINNGVTCGHRDMKSCHAILSFAGPSITALNQTEPDLRSSAASMLAAQAYRVITRLLLKASRPTPDENDLTGREKQAISLMAQGHTHRTLAKHLGVTERTVIYYMDRVAKKLKLTSRTNVVETAVARGLVHPHEPIPLRFKID